MTNKDFKWKRLCIDQLESYYRWIVAIRNINAQIKLCQDDRRDLHAVDTTKPHVTENRGDRSGREDMILVSMDLEEELRDRLEWTKEAANIVMRGLAVLTKEDQLVLDKMYMRREKFAVRHLCELLGCEQSSVYRRRDAALHRYCEAVFGKGESNET